VVSQAEIELICKNSERNETHNSNEMAFGDVIFKKNLRNGGSLGDILKK
jgi:hypothetical protein